MPRKPKTPKALAHPAPQLPHNPVTLDTPGQGPAIRIPSRIEAQIAMKLGPELRAALERIGDGRLLHGFARLASDPELMIAAASSDAAVPHPADLPISASVEVQGPEKSEAWHKYKDRAHQTLGAVSERMTRNAGLPEIQKSYSARTLGFVAKPGQIEEAARDNSIALLDLDRPKQVTALNEAAVDIELPAFRLRHSDLDGSGIKVAVLDSGIDLEHPWLRVAHSVSIVGEPVEIPGEHGTHVAGCLASRDSVHRGVAPGVILINIRVLDSRGRGRILEVGLGIDRALDEGASMINLSLGWNQRPKRDGAHAHSCPKGECPLCLAVNTAMTVPDGAVAVLAAAGNEHQLSANLRLSDPSVAIPTELLCPGQASQALTVAALAKGTFTVAAFSSRGPSADKRSKPDLSAPGVNIWSCRPVPRDPTGRPIPNPKPGQLGIHLSGTSMATPIVTGVAALFLQHLARIKPGLSIPDQRRELRGWLLTKGVRAVAGKPVEVGHGRISLAGL